VGPARRPDPGNLPALLADNGAGRAVLAMLGVSDVPVGRPGGGVHRRKPAVSSGSFFRWADLVLPVA
jgi:hypothetical protein